MAPLVALGLITAASAPAQAQLRVAAWNISFYDGGREADLKNVIYGQFQGQSMAPDVIMTLEFASQTAVNDFVSYLNTAGGPTDWAAAPYVAGPDSNAAFFFRASKVTYLGTTIVGYGSGDTNNQPRNTYRYDVQLVGYGDVPGVKLACYAVHMKAQGGTNSAGRRLVEAQRIRLNAAGHDVVDTLTSQTIAGTALPAGWNFLVGGDMNAQSDSESFYAEYVGFQADNTGRFFDPIKSPGTWNNNSAFRILHTQDPAGAGGMDDRHDQILVCASLVDGSGFDYLGNPAVPYSTSTWNDPNHSYRAWGNDGTMCPSNSNCGPNLTVTNNAMVGASIAQSIINACGPSAAGHLPVFLDLRVPPRVASATTIDFGQVTQNAAAQATLAVSNAGDTAKWTAPGIANLSYTLAPSAGFTAPAGAFTDAAGGGVNQHTITMNTSTPGTKSGTITIASNAPDQPLRTVTLTGVVLAPSCAADWNHDGSITPIDVALFINDFFASLTDGTLIADFNGDGAVTPADVASYVNAWFDELSAGC